MKQLWGSVIFLLGWFVLANSLWPNRSFEEVFVQSLGALVMLQGSSRYFAHEQDRRETP